MYVAIIGPPGAGKGTQSSRLADRFGIPHVSTGQILREAIAAGAPAVLRAQSAVGQGALVDDATMLDIVRERLIQHDARHGALLDGFPRTVVQARALDGFLAERSVFTLVVVVLEVPRDELLRRLRERGRFDDTDTAIGERLNNYLSVTQPVVDFDRHRPTFGLVDGSRPPDVVFRHITSVIESGSPHVRCRQAAEERNSGAGSCIDRDRDPFRRPADARSG